MNFTSLQIFAVLGNKVLHLPDLLNLYQNIHLQEM